MIKQITKEEYNKRKKKYFITMIFGIILVSFSMVSLCEILFFNDYSNSIFILGIYGIFPLLIGIGLIGRLDEQYNNPENFVYCKKCGKIIPKKDMFCNVCRQSIKRSFEEVENKKYFKEYKKFYKKKDKEKSKKK